MVRKRYENSSKEKRQQQHFLSTHEKKVPRIIFFKTQGN
jgi:hypothetical protein